jgi:hypothetical protein
MNVKFTLHQDGRTFDVSDAKNIKSALQQRGYRWRGYGAWVKLFPSKKAANEELAWIRKRGYEAEALVKHCGRRRFIDLATDELRNTLAAENASYERTRKAMHPSPQRGPKVSAWREVIDYLRSIENN